MLLLFNKPFRVLTQFRDGGGRATLADYIDLPAVYPAGRLDRDSEGLLLLTDEGPLQARIAEPRHKLAKHYWVQVEGAPDDTHLATLTEGIALKDGPARALSVAAIGEPARLWPRNPPIRERRHIPTAWLDIVIDEGRNRQVRRMTAAVGLPALRLIRHRVGPWLLADLEPGASTSIDSDSAWAALRAYRG